MPRVMRRPHRRRSTWGEGHIDQLLSGHGFSFTDNFGDASRGTLDTEMVREAWSDLGEELLAQWIGERPCSRPWCWWYLDARERRRRIGSMRLKPGRQRGGDDDDYEFVDDGKPHPFDSDERNTKVAEWRRTHPEIAEREAYRLEHGARARS